MAPWSDWFAIKVPCVFNYSTHLFETSQLTPEIGRYDLHKEWTFDQQALHVMALKKIKSMEDSIGKVNHQIRIYWHTLS